MKQQFLVVDASIRESKNGSKYLRLNLKNQKYNTGISGNIWKEHDFKDFKDDLDKELVLLIDFEEQTYNDNLQLNIKKATKVEEADIDNTVFVSSEMGIKYLEEKLLKYVDEIKHVGYKALINAVINHTKMFKLLKESPAAKTNHHNFRNGLIEHTCGMLGFANQLLNHYTIFNKDLLYAGIIFHDIGKIAELEKNGTYTKQGKLIGHITLGSLYIHKFCEQINQEKELITKDERDLLIHLVLSHHGNVEWGSPVVPKVPEAFALHMIDYWDAHFKVLHDTLRDKEVDSFTRGTTMTIRQDVYKHHLVNIEDFYYKKN